MILDGILGQSGKSSWRLEEWRLERFWALPCTFEHPLFGRLTADSAATSWLQLVKKRELAWRHNATKVQLRRRGRESGVDVPTVRSGPPPKVQILHSPQVGVGQNCSRSYCPRNLVMSRGTAA